MKKKNEKKGLQMGRTVVQPCVDDKPMGEPVGFNVYGGVTADGTYVPFLSLVETIKGFSLDIDAACDSLGKVPKCREMTVDGKWDLMITKEEMVNMVCMTGDQVRSTVADFLVFACNKVRDEYAKQLQ